MAPPRDHMFYIGFYREKQEKIFLSESTRLTALIFGMEHHLLNLYQVCSNYVPGAKNDRSGGHMFYIALYRKNMKKSSLLKPQGIEP